MRVVEEIDQFFLRRVGQPVARTPGARWTKSRLEGQTFIATPAVVGREIICGGRTCVFGIRPSLPGNAQLQRWVVNPACSPCSDTAAATVRPVAEIDAVKRLVDDISEEILHHYPETH